MPHILFPAHTIMFYLLCSTLSSYLAMLLLFYLAMRSHYVLSRLSYICTMLFLLSHTLFLVWLLYFIAQQHNSLPAHIFLATAFSYSAFGFFPKLYTRTLPNNSISNHAAQYHTHSAPKLYHTASPIPFCLFHSFPILQPLSFIPAVLYSISPC